MSTNVAKVQFHSLIQIGHRGEKKERDETLSVPANVGKGQFRSLNQSANRNDRNREEKSVPANVD